MHTLQSPHWRLWLDPNQGVSWRALQARRGDDWLHITPDCRNGGPLNAANFVMLPYSNRVRDGKFTFAGTDVQLEGAAQHAIHGALRKLPWDVATATDDHLSCHFDSVAHVQRGHAPINWPWPIAASIDHVLAGNLLTSEIELTNRGTTPMPAGFGWHPYFLRRLVPDNVGSGAPMDIGGGAPPELRVPVSGVFPDANGDCLPDGAAVDLPATLDFRVARSLDPAQHIDNCFSGLDGDIDIRWPDADLGLVMRSSAVCRYAIVYNPAEPFFAVEPVTNANDAFNLHSRGIEAGVHVLEPDESLKASMVFELKDHSAHEKA